MLPSGKLSWKRICRNIIISLVVFIIISFAAAKIIYDGIFCRFDGNKQPVPAALTNISREVSFSGSEGTLYGRLYTAENSQRLMVIVPGFRSNTTYYAQQANEFVNSGMSVFVFDATGSGESQGDSAVGFSQIILDLNSALDYIRKQKLFGCSEIVLFGHSRGAYAACCALENNKDISAVISVSGINSAMEAVMAPATQRVGFLAYSGYPFLWLYQASIFGGKMTDMEAAHCIEQSKVPTLIIHGEEDKTVAIDEGSVIAHRDEITRGQVEYFISTVDGQDGHTDILFDRDGTANDTLVVKVTAFLDKVLKEYG